MAELTADEMIAPSNRLNRMPQLCASDPTAVAPGNGTYACCPIVVPYMHRVRRALFAFNDVAVVGELKVKLMCAEKQGAKAGVRLGAEITLTDSTDKVWMDEFVLSEPESDFTEGLRYYWLVLTGTNAGDLVTMPALTLTVETSPSVI